MGDVDQRGGRVVPVRGPVDQPLLEPDGRDRAEHPSVDLSGTGEVELEAEPVAAGCLPPGRERAVDPLRSTVGDQDQAERRPGDEQLRDRTVPRGRCPLRVHRHERRSISAWIRNRLYRWITTKGRLATRPYPTSRPAASGGFHSMNTGPQHIAHQWASSARRVSRTNSCNPATSYDGRWRLLTPPRNRSPASGSLSFQRSIRS